MLLLQLKSFPSHHKSNTKRRDDRFTDRFILFSIDPTIDLLVNTFTPKSSWKVQLKLSLKLLLKGNLSLIEISPLRLIDQPNNCCDLLGYYSVNGWRKDDTHIHEAVHLLKKKKFFFSFLSKARLCRLYESCMCGWICNCTDMYLMRKSNPWPWD